MRLHAIQLSLCNHINIPLTSDVFKHTFTSRVKQIQQPTVEDDEKIDVSCEKVRSRGYYANASDNPFSIAYIRIVYKDYHLQELLFNLMYSPTNVFCYAIDKKATKVFHQQMQNLSECFSNVHLTATEYEVDSAG
ncbi:unnamed protein product, partial [Anisakis simplex]|uniref:Uncharacterized protein n=1 Tax=Anisakis simplex TaxID=6269 RepID=A0A0M3JGW8_ANISI